MTDHRLTIDTGMYEAGDVKPRAYLSVYLYPDTEEGVYAQVLINGSSACLDEDMTAQLIQALLGESG